MEMDGKKRNRENFLRASFTAAFFLIQRSFHSDFITYVE
jgi:hypothetical protein